MPTFPEADQTVVYARVKAALDHIVMNYEGSVLIVGHQCPIRQAAIALVGTEGTLLVKMCAVNRFEHAPDTGLWQLIYSGAGHLRAL